MQQTSRYSLLVCMRITKNTLTQFPLCPLGTLVHVLHSQFECRPKDNTELHLA